MSIALIGFHYGNRSENSKAVAAAAARQMSLNSFVESSIERAVSAGN